jgi:hypothetical protein
MPLLALLLMGPRMGWSVAALSMALYAVTPALVQTGCFAFIGVPVSDEAAPLAFWALQGLRTC